MESTKNAPSFIKQYGGIYMRSAKKLNGMWQRGALCRETSHGGKDVTCIHEIIRRLKIHDNCKEESADEESRCGGEGGAEKKMSLALSSRR